LQETLLVTKTLAGHDFYFEKDGAIQSSTEMTKKLYVDEDFLKTADIHLLQGRNFSAGLATDRLAAIIINETLMKQLGYTNAIGKKVQYRRKSKCWDNKFHYSWGSKRFSCVFPAA
jgi:putative ABC transport system permease protein